MPLVFAVNPGIAQVTSATPLTQTTPLSLFQNGSLRAIRVMGLYVHGKGAGLTAISGISFRVKKMSSGSTGGTIIGAAARDPGVPSSPTWSAKRDCNTDGTLTNTTLSIGCGAAGASGWFSPGEASNIVEELVA